MVGTSDGQLLLYQISALLVADAISSICRPYHPSYPFCCCCLYLPLLTLKKKWLLARAAAPHAHIMHAHYAPAAVGITFVPKKCVRYPTFRSAARREVRRVQPGCLSGPVVSGCSFSCRISTMLHDYVRKLPNYSYNHTASRQNPARWTAWGPRALRRTPLRRRSHGCAASRGRNISCSKLCSTT